MPIVILNGPIIEAGESLSGPLNCSAGTILKVTMPMEWTMADLTFQTSSDGLGFNDIFDRDGREVTVRCGGANTAVIGLNYNIGWVKFRSGSRERPIPQAAQREFAVALGTGADAVMAWSLL